MAVAQLVRDCRFPPTLKHGARFDPSTDKGRCGSSLKESVASHRADPGKLWVDHSFDPGFFPGLRGDIGACDAFSDTHEMRGFDTLDTLGRESTLAPWISSEVLKSMTGTALVGRSPCLPKPSRYNSAFRLLVLGLFHEVRTTRLVIPLGSETLSL